MGSRIMPAPDDAGDQPVRFDSDDHQPASGGQRSAAAIVVLVLGGLALLWLISGLGSRDRSDPPVPEVEALDDQPAFVEPTPVPTPLPTPVPTPTPNPFIDERAARTAWSQLSAAAPGHAIAYRGPDGIAVLDFEANAVDTMGSISFEPGTPASTPEATSDATELVSLIRLATGRAAATTAREGVVALVVADGVFVVDLRSGDGSESHQLPEGAVVTAVDGVGVVAYEPGVGTWGFGADGPELLSDRELVSVSPSATIERACRGCPAVLVDVGSGETLVLPDEFNGPDSRLIVSPHGGLVLHVRSDGSAELFEAATRSVFWVNGSGIVEPVWAPDSSFVAWIDTDDPDDPRLKVMLPSRREWIVARLRQLGAPAPAKAAVEAFDRS